MTKTKAPPYYGRLGHDTDISQVRESISEAQEVLDRMIYLLDNELTFEQACNEIEWLWSKTQVMMSCPMLRPIFLSHLIGRLRADGLPLSVVADKAKTTKQRIHHMLYDGAAGRPTAVPRTRRKRPVARGVE